ncbi:phage gp6-like head-tail connector protein [Pseudorhizobium endolithicum]|uniref:Phage gp6-like head-tail connector protein n=1 Tax=Pseudorhizobium endolithicum TaxID=1191678 RepID=A0ABM8PFM4_9HYPH|nr:head-tail connector protein [Pseudorhizobium endolithicum]CAD7027304.1 phage gp6-like head-tail connector protein [Pseudorhizobium endolithicum]
MTYAQTTPPAAEPLTLAEVKAHLRLDDGEEDALLLSLLATAREHLERETGLCLMAQSWRLHLDDWPADGIIRIAKSPVQAIPAVTVFDAEGEPLQVPLEDHLLDGEGRPARLWLRNPPAPGQSMNGIEIGFSAGFGEAGTDVPDTLKRAMLIHVGHMFAFRGVISPDQQPAGIPDGYDRLVAPFRMRRL